MPSGIQVTGVDQLLRKLQTLPAKVQGKVVRPAVREGAKITLAKAKALVPVDADGHQLPGGKHLRDTLKNRANPNRKRGEISIRVMTGTREELGIPAKHKGYYPSALEYGGLDQFPVPYMRPAYEQTRDKVIQSVRDKVIAGIEREASK